jgi:hypothetical protein
VGDAVDFSTGHFLRDLFMNARTPANRSTIVSSNATGESVSRDDLRKGLRKIRFIITVDIRIYESESESEPVSA